jgi:hypothetical protein
LIWRRRNQADADTRHVARIAISAGLLCALVQPTTAMARETESFTCTLTDQVRRIERVFEPGGAPCTVEYYRNDQPPRTMWRARESGSVCVDGARKMVQDFRAAGYSCTGAPTEPAAGAGESRPAGSLCYALTYEVCGPGGGNCDMKPASICAQSDNRWLMTDGMPGDLDPLTRFLPGDPGKCYRVYRDGQPRPLCTEAPGSPNTVWSLR